MSQIDIVIPSAGRPQDLVRLLESIHAHCSASSRSLLASITVTDDRHSTSIAEQLAREFPAVHYVAGPARGPAANRNHGARLGRADWILFLDDDCYIEADVIQAYLNHSGERLDCDVLEGAIHPVGPRPNGNHHAPLNLQGGCLWSCNLMLRRQTFLRVGGFDEQFPYACMEDVDLRERLGCTDARVCFAINAVVFHPWRSISEREVSRQIISHAIYAQTHPDFVHQWTLMHLLRALRGRVRQYQLGSFASIPWSKYRTVAYDCLAPLLVYVVMHIGPLRHRLSDRHRNRWLGNA